MRPILGHEELRQQIKDYCHSLCYPRRLDFSIVNNIKSIRTKINYQWKKAHEPLDIKICPGGIRDVELYIQSLQVIYGGKNPQVQTASMTEAMESLNEIKALKDEDHNFLKTFYWQLRQIENLIHITEDKHTYRLEEKLWETAGNLSTNAKQLNLDLERANGLISDFFEEPSFEPRTKKLNEQNLSPSSQKAIQDIYTLKSHSLKKSKIETLKNQILSHYLSHLEEIALDKDLAIQSFRDFIYAIKSKSSIFHLFDRYPGLLEDLAWLFSLSPYVGQLLSRRPELLDSFALGQVAIDEDADMEELLESLIDYKMLGQLSAIISLVRKKDIDSYCTQLSNQADFIVSKLVKKLESEMDTKPLRILCMGKWSGFEMGIQSDLDFVFLTESAPSTEQLKMARRLINLITNHTKGGKLFNIDLRLKPNQNAGPLILPEKDLNAFIQKKAEGWQKQAYLRSRILNEKTFYFRNSFNDLRLSNTEYSELSEIHKKILTSNSRDSIDIKSCYGGLIHTEFTLQKICLLKDKAPQFSSTADILDCLDLQPGISSQILSNYKKIRMIEQLLQICNDNSRTKVSVNDPNTERVASIIGHKDFYSDLKELVTEQQHLLKTLT